MHSFAMLLIDPRNTSCARYRAAMQALEYAYEKDHVRKNLG